MKLKFNLISYGIRRYSREINTAYLRSDNWDDYGFKTQFYLEVVDGEGNEISIGQVKIGYVDQDIGWTAGSMPASFDELPQSYFSLGQDVDYYKNIESLPDDLKNQLLDALRDMVADQGALTRYENEKVFTTSLLRSSSYLSIGDQYRRILLGGAEQTPYNFIYKVDQNNESAGLELRFGVRPESKPSTNIHVLIGRNGIGKTTLLNGMISALIKKQEIQRGFGNFWDMSTPTPQIIENDYFTALVSVSFSAFDPFTPPMDIEEPGQHIRYSYIGLKKVFQENGISKSEHKDIEKFADDFLVSAAACFNSDSKRKRWIRAIRFLESDNNFADMDLTRFATDVGQHRLQGLNRRLFEKMSSGHAIILLTITKLVEKVDEKTLVLMDEPESHLHPPLLSAFTRALADLLTNRNGVAIIATHSPVLLQEVPRECVWKLRRNGLVASADRPECETFAENVGFLTREVFQLEVAKSGFHHLLEQSVYENKSYDEILSDYSGKIGFEGKALLRAMLTAYAEGRL